MTPNYINKVIAKLTDSMNQMNQLNVMESRYDDNEYDSSADLLYLLPPHSRSLWSLPEEVEQDSLDGDWAINWVKTKTQREKESMHLLNTEQIITNSRGGRQSHIHGDYTLLPQTALEQAAIVLEEGAAKYGALNWKDIPMMSHLNHAYRHLAIASELFHAGRGYPDNLQLLEELSHALVRTMFCIDRLLDNDYDYHSHEQHSVVKGSGRGEEQGASTELAG